MSLSNSTPKPPNPHSTRHAGHSVIFFWCKTSWVWRTGLWISTVEKPCSYRAATQAGAGWADLPTSCSYNNSQWLWPWAVLSAAACRSFFPAFSSLVPSGLLRRELGTTPKEEAHCFSRNKSLKHGHSTGRSRYLVEGRRSRVSGRCPRLPHWPAEGAAPHECVGQAETRTFSWVDGLEVSSLHTHTHTHTRLGDNR